jgi:predicted lysophospholipase L1 biosynthesis ABC-type transport system permease subunit
MPRTEQEIALAPTSADATGVAVGDRISLGGGAVRRTMTVTGIAFVPNGPHNGYSDGAWATPAGYARLFEGARYAYKYHWAVIALRPGVDPAAARENLKAVAATVKGGAKVGFVDPEGLPEVQQLRDVQQLPVILAGFLAVLAVGAVGHALATAVRRRRHDVAVLRALGMTRVQARWTVVVQATLLAMVGLAFGVPLGVALGRVLWRVVADITPLAYVAPIAIVALLLAWPLALAVANVLALWPGRIAAHMRIGHVLRAE